MKTNLSICLAMLSSVSALSIAALAQEPARPAPAQVKPEKAEETFAGIVKEKKETQLLIKRDDGQGDVKVTLADNVQITKNDAPASANDLVAGVHVELKVKSKGDSLGAVAIKILPR